MTLSSRIIFEVARKYMIDPALLVKRCRRRVVVFARIEVAKRLQACGYSPTRIARCLGHDHTTISFYLGHLTRAVPRVGPPQWRRPVIRYLCYCRSVVEEPPKPPPKGLHYLKPYAGADPTTYQWRQRA